MSVGERLRALRRARGLTLAHVAGDAVSVPLVSKIERGLASPSLATLEALAKNLGVAPGALLDGHTEAATREQGHTPGVVGMARARLLLGDPAGAARAADQAPSGSDHERAHLLAVQAEAALAIGDTDRAADDVLAGSRLGGGALAQAELAWVLGLLERRRCDRGATQRAWAAALDALAQTGLRQPLAALLAARIQAELAALHEQEGGTETARHFLDRADATLANLADPTALARMLLADEGSPGGGATNGALAVALLVAAQRLVERVRRDRERLIRTSGRWSAAPAPAEIPHSRHLR